MDSGNIKGSDSGHSANNESASLLAKIESIVDSILQKKAAATQKTRAVMDRATTTVRARPLMSMVMILFAGILVGRMYAMLKRL